MSCTKGQGAELNAAAGLRRAPALRAELSCGSLLSLPRSPVPCRAPKKTNSHPKDASPVLSQQRCILHPIPSEIWSHHAGDCVLYWHSWERGLGSAGMRGKGINSVFNKPPRAQSDLCCQPDKPHPDTTAEASITLNDDVCLKTSWGTLR